MSKETPPAKQPTTVGEELFLVHLSRETPDERLAERDIDGQPRKRSRSVGEELFEIHLKRSQGFEPDCDVPNDEKPKTTPRMPKKKTHPPVSHVIHLRSRDVPPLH